MKRHSSGKLPLRFAAASWIAWLLILVLLETQHRFGTQHFAPLPFICLFALMVLSFLLCIGFGIRHFLRGQNRSKTVVLMLAACVPFCFWIYIGGYAFAAWSHRSKPNSFPMQTARRGAASVMNAELAWSYPHRIVRSRFTMFYHNVSSPEADADKMDAYLTELEQYSGHSIRVPIYWVRGKLLGQSRLSDYGLALGSENSPVPAQIHGRTLEELEGTDRHEVAHAVIHQWQIPASDPPTFLEEGWAEGFGSMHGQIVSAAVSLVAMEREGQVPRRGTLLHSLLSADTYYHDEGAIYPCGAYIVLFLIEKFGFDKFMQLYTSIRFHSAASDFEHIFGTDLDTLEKQMWQEADRLTKSSK